LWSDLGENLSKHMTERTKTKINLQVALAGEADTNRRYTAYGIRALHEGYPEIAQLFFEAAGAETVHAYSHLMALDAIGTTLENLRTAAKGETTEIEQTYPRMIAEAEDEGDLRAAASFRLALERERYHQQSFRRALVSLQDRGGQTELRDGQTFSAVPPLSAATVQDSRSQQEDNQRATGTQEVQGKNVLKRVMPAPPSLGERRGSEAAPSRSASSYRAETKTGVDRATAKRGLKEIEGERERIAQLAGIREVVFGGQDGLISTTTLVAGIAATTTQNVVVLVAGIIAAIAGALSMTVGSYLASRAQRQLYESELANEQREVAEKPGEEMAELLAALIGRGMPRNEAIEVMRRIAAHPGLMLDMLGAFELGLVPGSLGSPTRDALVTGMAFVVGSAVPLLPFIVLEVKPALMVTMLLALGALFALGMMKAWLSGRPMVVSGLEVLLLGGTAGAFGYGLGLLVSTFFGISI
jgi:VIT1/CCC1 family predicted Fe2+/Mn2+ transporter/rubrerythrin